MPTYDPNNDTYSAKGFVSFGAAANNTPDTVADVGELSVRSETYSKDRLIFGGAAGSTPDTSVTVSIFSSRDVVEGDKVAVPTVYSDAVLAISEWAYRQAVLGNFTNVADEFRQQIMEEFEDEVADVEVGPMVRQGTSSLYLPSYVIFYLVQDFFTEAEWADTDEETLYSQPRFKLWFADAAFQDQYDEFELEFIAPIATLDDFFLLSATVRNNVAARTLPQWTDLIQTKAGEDPYTILKMINFNYHDPNDTDSTSITSWAFIIYGAGGDNIDAQKNALAQWILDNSTHTREEWVVLFPDIFTSTEFIITPLWTQYSVPNKTLDPGVYSPVTEVARAMTIARVTSTGTNYDDAHIDANLCVVGSLYKSIALLAVGGPENIDSKYKFNEKWPDYMVVPTGSPDFNRMQPKTQQLVNLFYALLQVAEEMTEFSDIPQGYTRLTRVNADNQKILYIVSSIDNVQYLVVAKSSLEKYFPAPIDPTALSLSPAPSATLHTPTASKHLQLNVEASGGVAPYTYHAASTDIASGGINLNTGFLDVLFINYGTNHIDVTVTDALNATYTATYTVVCPAGP